MDGKRELPAKADLVVRAPPFAMLACALPVICSSSENLQIGQLVILLLRGDLRPTFVRLSEFAKSDFCEFLPLEPTAANVRNPPFVTDSALRTKVANWRLADIAGMSPTNPGQVRSLD